MQGRPSPFLGVMCHFLLLLSITNKEYFLFYDKWQRLARFRTNIPVTLIFQRLLSYLNVLLHRNVSTIGIPAIENFPSELLHNSREFLKGKVKSTVWLHLPLAFGISVPRLTGVSQVIHTGGDTGLSPAGATDLITLPPCVTSKIEAVDQPDCHLKSACSSSSCHSKWFPKVNFWGRKILAQTQEVTADLIHCCIQWQ